MARASLGTPESYQNGEGCQPKTWWLSPSSTAYRSPWQNPYCERVIGSIRRDCLDHIIVLSEQHLRRIMAEYIRYYNESRTHMSLDGNSPVPREVEPPSNGKVVAIPFLGGLQHRYTRAA